MIPVKYSEINDYQKVELFENEEMLFTELRVERSSLPEGLFAYDLRHKDDDWGIPCELEKRVLVNFFGTVLTDMPINLGDEGFRILDNEDFAYIDDEPIEGENIIEYFKNK